MVNKSEKHVFTAGPSKGSLAEADPPDVSVLETSHARAELCHQPSNFGVPALQLFQFSFLLMSFQQLEF